MFQGKVRRKDLDGYYSVGEDGVVCGGGLALVPVRGVWVSIHGQRRYVAWLVAQAFVPNPQGWRYVVHRNGRKDDNRAENLEWSPEPEERGKRGPKPRMGMIEQINEGGDRVGVYRSVAEASEASGIRPELIRAALGRRNGRTGGYFWLWHGV